MFSLSLYWLPFLWKCAYPPHSLKLFLPLSLLMLYFENLPWRQTLSLQRQHNTVPIYSAAQKLEPGDDSRQGGNAHTDGHMGLQSQAMIPVRVGTPIQTVTRTSRARRWFQTRWEHLYRWSHWPPHPGDDSRQGGNTHTDCHTGLQRQAMMPDGVGTPIQLVTWASRARQCSRQGGNTCTDGHTGLQSQAMMPDWVGTPHTDSHMGLQSQVMIPDGVGMPV